MIKKWVFILGSIVLGVTSIYANPVVDGITKPVIPSEGIGIELPELPKRDTEDELETGWRLEKNYTAFLESKLNVFVPLEILSDIDINAVVIDDEELNVPFELEMNKEPERKDYYKLKYSETEIDIDNDGQIDTFIYSPKYINQRVIKDNYVLIKGKNISKDGDYYKKIYITIEVDE
ncbi:hypothetical protein [Cetobacterium somerae]|uniref:hypothetical protein n=1 Tax=Cetobacterium somerae TaxID=188913 RepID=UPI003891781A